MNVKQTKNQVQFFQTRVWDFYSDEKSQTPKKGMVMEMNILNGKKLILASKSPRRDELLTMAGLPHEIFATDADESSVAYTSGEPEKYVAALSLLKAGAAVDAWTASDKADVVFLSADTVVYAPETKEVLGKPKDRADAHRMLRLLSGGKHRVITGCTIVAGEKSVTGVVSTDVWFRELSDEEIYAYIDNSVPYDKAGAYGIQESASVFVPRIDGDYFNIVGLPVQWVYVTLKDLC